MRSSLAVHGEPRFYIGQLCMYCRASLTRNSPRNETAAGARARSAVRPLAIGLLLVFYCIGDPRQCS